MSPWEDSGPQTYVGIGEGSREHCLEHASSLPQVYGTDLQKTQSAVSHSLPNRKELGLETPNSQPHVHTFHSELGISSLENPRPSSCPSPECLPHCVTWTWGTAHHFTLRLFPALHKVPCACQTPGLVWMGDSPVNCSVPRASPCSPSSYTSLKGILG